ITMSNDAVASSVPVRRGGRGLAAFALLLAVSALGLAAYPYYRQLNAPPTIDDPGALRDAQQRQADELQRVVGKSAEIESQLRRQQQRLDETRVAPSMPDGSAPSVLTPEAQRALKLVETDYLLRNANDRLLVQRDVPGALTLLLAAQSLASQIDLPAMASVRDALATDIEALRNDPGIDVRSASSRLSSLARTVLELPTRGVRFSSNDAGVAVATTATLDSTAPVESTLELAAGSAWQKFRSLFEFRRERGTARPPLGPDEAAYLRMNLALQLSLAELALLRNDASVYQQSLGSARRWIDEYLDPAAVLVTTARADIDQLLTLRLDRALPDISGSLSALRPVIDAYGGQPSPPAAIEPAAQPQPDAAAAGSGQ
ncbi:MAG TPA: uroporphyrinogen-III C-methyltransferase, partial [Pseudomonadales bacterium]